MRCIEKTLYTNGRIVTMDAAGTVAEAVLVAGNVIEAVGSKDGLAALAGSPNLFTSSLWIMAL